MISEINSFTAYLQEVKHTAKNTEVSYHRDLLQMAGFMEEVKKRLKKQAISVYARLP